MQYSSNLAASIDQFIIKDGINQSSIGGLRLYRSGCDVPRQPVVIQPSICVVAQGQKMVYLGNVGHNYDPNHYLISSLTMPIDTEVRGTRPNSPYLGLSLEVDANLVSQLILKMDRYQSEQALTSQGGIISAVPMTDHLQHCFIRLVRLNADPMEREVLADVLKREIFYEVLKGPQGGLLRNCISNHHGANRITPVVQFIEKNFHRPLDIDTISQVAQMSPSALHEQFKMFTSLSPIQFVKNLRLHQAHTLLLSGTKASEASYQVGYNSPSQFSREFRRLFGCSPKEVRANG